VVSGQVLGFITSMLMERLLLHSSTPQKDNIRKAVTMDAAGTSC